MSSEAVLSIILGVLGLLGTGGLWTYLKSRTEAPVLREQADIAAASTTVQMALSIATAARAHSEAVGKEMDELKGRVDALSHQVLEQERTISSLREVVRSFSSAWDDLVERWQTIRQQEAPPPKPRTYNP